MSSTALIGSQAISDSACCDTSPEVATVKRTMAGAAKRVIVLADAGKFGQVAFCDAFPLEDVCEIITDYGLDPATRRRLETRGIKVSAATVDGGPVPPGDRG